MPDPIVEEQPGTQTADAAQGCPVEMDEGRLCGRAICAAPIEVDKKPVCLMHSHDPNKDDAAFHEEFERILQGAGEGTADFTRFVFPTANYSDREFNALCIFCYAIFRQQADFRRVTFKNLTNFIRATFAQEANFSGANFTKCVPFFGATFSQTANFNLAEFTEDAIFMEAAFAGDSDFSGACFTKAADFKGATFKEGALFGETIFREDASAQPGLIFGRARFAKPELVIFYRTYMGHALFHNCDVSRFVFSNVRWRERDGSQKQMVFEEIISTEDGDARALLPGKEAPDQRNYALIAELYQQLKKNYDDRRDYWTAGDFHYGELEMKRLHSPHRNKALRWLHQNLGLCAWYKYASEYGESYDRPLLWFVGIVVLFMLLFPISGLRPSVKPSAPGPAPYKSRPAAEGQMPELSYTNLIRYGSTEPGGPRVTSWSLLGHSLMSTIGVASFQRDLTYEPSYPWGRVLAMLEILLTSAVGALFLLALRRQFRR